MLHARYSGVWQEGKTTPEINVAVICESVLSYLHFIICEICPFLCLQLYLGSPSLFLKNVSS